MIESMHLLDPDLGDFLLAITVGICLAQIQGRRTLPAHRDHREVSRVSTLIVWRRCFATIGMRTKACFFRSALHVSHTAAQLLQ